MAVVEQDFFLDPRERLTDEERALMTGMLADLLGGIADEIRARLPADWGAVDDGDGHHLLRQLGSAGLLGGPELIAILLRRADEERIGRVVQARSNASSAFFQAMIADGDDAVAATAMALVLARGRRRDRFGQPRIDLDDLPEQVARTLVHSVAADANASIPSARRHSRADPQIASATAGPLGRYDRARSLEAVTRSLVRALIDAGRLDDALLESAADEGEVAFLAEALGQRAEIGTDAAWDHLIEGHRGRFALLLRMAGVSRDLAARLFAGLGDLVGIADVRSEIERFDALDEVQVNEARQWLALDGEYRAALVALGVTRG